MELPSKANSSFEFMVKLLKDLNIPMSQSKLTPPTTKIMCLGIDVDSVQATLSIPPSPKLVEILEECVKFKKRTRFTKRQLQSIIGKLMFVHKVVKPARLFVKRLLNLLRNMGGSVSLSRDMVRDINWFCEFLQIFNGTCHYIHPPLIGVEPIELDT